jgi:hypothetical protein
LNARRHTSGAGTAVKRFVRLDRASSARWFEGWKPGRLANEDLRVVPIPRPVARARTWLLKIGWRRRGLLDPADVPG